MSRRRFTPEERATVWRGWKSGLTIKQISEILHRPPPSVFLLLKRDGGFAPGTRRRAARALRLEEREEISRGLASGLSIRQISRRLGRAASTVSREIGRNGGVQGYRAAQADARAWRGARRPQRCLLARRPRLRTGSRSTCSSTGRRARSPLALSRPSRMMARCGYRTRPSIEASSFRRATS